MQERFSNGISLLSIIADSFSNREQLLFPFQLNPLQMELISEPRQLPLRELSRFDFHQLNRFVQRMLALQIFHPYCRYPSACIAVLFRARPCSNNRRVSSTNPRLKHDVHPAHQSLARKSLRRPRKTEKDWGETPSSPNFFSPTTESIFDTTSPHSDFCCENGLPVSRITSTARTTRRGFLRSIFSYVTGSFSANSANNSASGRASSSARTFSSAAGPSPSPSRKPLK